MANDSAPEHLRQTAHGLLTGTYKDARGRWMMIVRRDDGTFADVPHDNVCPPATKGTDKKKRK